MDSEAELNKRQSLTFKLEIRRAISSGILETSYTTFLLLIAVRWFQVGPSEKSLIAAAQSIGFLIAPVAVYIARLNNWRISHAASAVLLISGLGYALAAISSTSLCFALASVLAVASPTTSIPLMTQIYQNNYTPEIRGKLYSRSQTLRIFTAVIFGAISGYLITGNLHLYPILICVFATAAILSAFWLRSYPSENLSPQLSRNPFSGFSLLLHDPVFARLMIAWSLMGFGNLMMFALRVEYLANPVYQLELSEFEIALFVSVIPNIARLLLSPLWGWLFDNTTFYWVRIFVNFSFAISIVTFFLSDSPLGLSIGAAVYGISTAGGELLWNLWSTKFAPPEKVADYMSVHTCLSGIRGILAPLAAFHLLELLNIPQVALISVAMILISSVLMFLESR